MIRIGRHSVRQFARFFAASFGGVVFDIALSYVLVRFAGLPILAASSISLLTAASAMYFVHEHWTFGSGGHFSGRRLISILISALVALTTRTLVLTSLNAILSESWVFLQLLAAVATSFLINYLIVRRIMRRHTHEMT